MNTSIKQIRLQIRRAAWVRNDFSGINSEFIAQPVDTILTAKIAELTALEIPARFVDDITERDEEIRRCLRVIGRWVAAKQGCPGDTKGLKLEAVVGPRVRPVLTVYDGGRA